MWLSLSSSGQCLPMITLHLVRTAECLGTFLRHLLQCCPPRVQILNLNTNLLGSFRLTHCRQTLSNCIQLNQTGLIRLQILCCTYCDYLNFMKNKKLQCSNVVLNFWMWHAYKNTHLPSGNHQICAELLQLVPSPGLLRPILQQFPTTHTVTIYYTPLYTKHRLVCQLLQHSIN